MFAVLHEMDHYVLASLLLFFLIAAGRRAGNLACGRDRRHLLRQVRRLRRSLMYAEVWGLSRVAVFAAI